MAMPPPMTRSCSFELAKRLSCLAVCGHLTLSVLPLYCQHATWSLCIGMLPKHGILLVADASREFKEPEGPSLLEGRCMICKDCCLSHQIAPAWGASSCSGSRPATKDQHETGDIHAADWLNVCQRFRVFSTLRCNKQGQGDSSLVIGSIATQEERCWVYQFLPGWTASSRSSRRPATNDHFKFLGLPLSWHKHQTEEISVRLEVLLECTQSACHVLQLPVMEDLL